jgi:class 3 adenylate cyclase/Tfp pilus assembly protein PilF
MATDRVERRLAAILAADVAGYSRLMGVDDVRTVRDLKGHQAVVLPMVRKFGGRIIDTAGDGILAEFSSVVNAVKCAVAIQSKIAERNAAIKPEQRIQFRMGVNIGDVIYDDSRIYGDGINIAARLEGIAEPGGICVSGSVLEQVQDKLNIAFEDIGEQQLKNIARSVRVYRLVLDQSRVPTRRAALTSVPQRAALPASNIPVRVPTHFMGRDDALAAIETALNRHEGRVAITALHGLRGVGKTTLAAAFAERHRGNYRATWWIRAQADPSIRADFVALGIRLGWVGADEKEEPAVAAVMERLRYEGDGILLIFDNAVDADALKPYLPRGGGARVLVTSNAHAWRGVAAPVEIRLWPKEIGADYLIARTGRTGERSAAEALSEALGGLPLAHEQAAAYCEHLDISLANYRKRFEAAPARLLDDARHAPAEYHDGLTVAKTFALAIEGATQLHLAAEPLIVHAALLAPEPIPLFLFAEAREKLGEPLATALVGDGLEEAVAALRTFALLNRETITDERDPGITTETVRLHRLVREVAAARREGKAREDALRALVEAVTAVYPEAEEVFTHPKTWPRARRLDALALALVDGNITPPEGAEARAAELLHRLSLYRHTAFASYAKAGELLERALAIREKVLGPEDPDTALSLNDLGFLIERQGHLAEARPLYERALAINEKALGPEHPATAENVANLGRLLWFQGDFARARSLLERALASFEKALGPEHFNTLTSLSNLALLIQTQGDLAGARTLHERALMIREKVLGPDHPHTARSLIRLASCVRAEGDLARARLLHERALTICERVLGPEHPLTADSLNGLAVLLHNQGDLVGARPLHERALGIREKVLGPAHMATAMSLSELAGLLTDEGDLAGAKQYYGRALATYEMISPEHPNTNRVRRNFARLLMAAGNAADALAFSKTALTGHEKVLGENHRWTRDSAGTTADALAALGRADEALALRNRYGFEPNPRPAA